MEQQFLQNSLWDVNTAQRVPPRQKQHMMTNEQTSFMDFISDRQPQHPVNQSLNEEIAYYNYNTAKHQNNSNVFTQNTSKRRALLPVKNEAIEEKPKEVQETPKTSDTQVLKSKEYHGAPLYGWVALGFAVTSILLLVIAFKLASKAKYILIAVGATLLIVSSIFVAVFIFDKYYNQTGDEACCGKKQTEKKINEALRGDKKNKSKKSLRFHEPPSPIREEDWEEESKYRRMVLERRRMERENQIMAVRNAEAMEQEGLNYFPSKIRKEHFPPQKESSGLSKPEYDRYLRGLHGIAEQHEVMQERYMPPVHHQQQDPPSGSRDWEDQFGIKSQPAGHMMNHRNSKPMKSQVPGKQFVPHNQQIEKKTIEALEANYKKKITDTSVSGEGDGAFTPISVEAANDHYQMSSRDEPIPESKEVETQSSFQKVLAERKKMNESSTNKPSPTDVQKKIDLATLSPWMQPVSTGKKSKQEQTQPEPQQIEAQSQQIDIAVPNINQQDADVMAKQIMKKYQNMDTTHLPDNAFGAHFGEKLWDTMAEN